jgi:lipopolysaccharide transport system ATP-binding protein
MVGRSFKVGLAGTFDVENFGDLLFPLIARRELEQRLGEVELHCFSYQPRAEPAWPYAVQSVTELPRLAPGLDALLIGGGFLVRFDKVVAAGYVPPSAEIHHPTGFWLSPALICQQHGVPVLWNAPGANYDDIPPWAESLLTLALSQSPYVAVRDERSRAALARFAAGRPIEVVPDTVFGLAGSLPEQTAADLTRLKDACGLSGPYIIIQPVRGLDACHRFLERHAARLHGYQLLSLPMGPVNGDSDALPAPDLPGMVRLPVWPPPLVIAQLIRQAAAVIGPSFHLAIAALTAGVPVFTPADLSCGKFSGLLGFDGIHPVPAGPDEDPEPFLSRLGRTAVPPQVDAAIERLKLHWDGIAAAIRAGRTDGALAFGRFWQSLPGLLEGHAARSAAAAAAAQELAAARETLGAERAAAASRIAELRRLVAMARTEIAVRDRRIAQLLSSTSWRLSAPLRFVGRRLGR